MNTRKIAPVTGASRGLGRNASLKLAARGAVRNNAQLHGMIARRRQRWAVWTKRRMWAQ